MVVISAEEPKPTLKKLVILQRHTARCPSRDYTKETPEWIKKYGAGRLTGVGERQAYLIGKQIMRDYKHFLAPISSLDTSVRSTGYSRTILTAHSFLSGLWQNVDKIVFQEGDPRLLPPYPIDKNSINVGENAIPTPINLDLITSETRELDKLMKLGTNIDCISTNPEMQPNESIKEKIEAYLKKSDYDEKTKESFGLVFEDTNTLDSCYKTGDFLISNYYSNETEVTYIPGNKIYDKMTQCYPAGAAYRMISSQYVNTVGSPLVEDILNNLEEKDKKGIAPTKLKYYAGHDVNLLSTLSILGNWDIDCHVDIFLDNKKPSECTPYPGFGSILIFELLSTSKNTSYVAVRYNDEYLDVCKDSSTSSTDTKHLCELSKFKTVLGKNIVKDWEKKCNLNGESKDENNIKVWWLLLILGANIILLSMITLIVISGNKKKSDRRTKRSWSENSLISGQGV